MRVSLSWLQQLVQVNDSVDALAERLSMAGFEVDEIDDLSARARGVVVGKVIEREKHPDADKLSVCRVDVGAAEPLQIVCGATNVRAGIHVPVARVGAVLPAVNLTIKAGELRGVASNGMICSLSELGLENDSDGIAVLNDLVEATLEPGAAAASVLGLDDTVLDLAITANRPDGLSMVGIAREVAALTGAPLNLPALTLNPDHQSLNTSEASDAAMRRGGLYGLTSIEGIDGSVSSPAWVKDRLERAGINRVNAVVDVTNVVMLEQGQPLHAFDADALEQLTGQPVDAASFGLRQAREGEAFTGLDDRELVLDPRAQVVTCHDRPVALAGVIGSRESGVTEATRRSTHAAELGALLDTAFRAVPTEELLARLHDHQVPAAPINDLTDMFEDPQVVHNEAIHHWDHPLMGPVRTAKPPVRFSETPADPRWAADKLGQSTREVLGEIGYDDIELATLAEKGVI